VQQAQRPPQSAASSVVFPDSPLSYEQVNELAIAVARREAHRPDDVDDLVQVGLFAYFKSDKTAGIRKPFAHARCVLQRAMWGEYTSNAKRETDRFLRLPDRPQTNQLEVLVQNDLTMHNVEVQIPAAGIDGEINSVHEDPSFIGDYLSALEAACGELARRIAENLILGPGGDCAAEVLAIAGSKAKQQRKVGTRSRGCPRGVKREIRVSHLTVQRAMGISSWQWQRTVQHIREFTRQYLDRD
jgi:hypothetical protein